jgi:hypothetical protein
MIPVLFRTNSNSAILSSVIAGLLRHGRCLSNPTVTEIRGDHPLLNPGIYTTRRDTTERHFYGTGGTVEVETALQSRESEYAPLIERLRQVDGPPPEGDKQSIDAFVLHLLARGRHTRDSAVDIAKSAVEASRQALTDTQYRDQLLERLVKMALANPQFVERRRWRPTFSKSPSEPLSRGH